MIIPAIDIRNGRCVRLLHGDFDAETVYDFDPVELATRYAASGATLVHVVDLDAARSGRPENLELILRMADAASTRVQVGGGIRSKETASDLLERGIDRVVLGSIAMKQPEIVVELVNLHGADRVCAALDVKPDGDQFKPVAEGWLTEVDTSLDALLQFYVKHGVEHVLITDVSRDGAMTGPNVELYRRIVSDYPEIRLQASGGVRSNSDIDDLRDTGASGAIVGRALLEGTITLAGV